MANKNRNINQPRRKRNKKPVKRYSEEYSNRPNPYTGYSADGNFHPEAKKHTLDEASVAVDSAVTVDNTADDVINGVSEITETESAKSTSGRRKKDIDRDAEKKAQQEKNEARRATVAKIAQGVAAHSVSEQIIEDIASLSDVMASMEKSDSSHDEADEQIASSSAYDDLTPSETDGYTDKDDKEIKEDEAVKSDEEDEAEIALPVVLEENETLPFDRDDDSEIEPEKEEKPTDSEDTYADDAAPIPPLNPADLIPVLDFDKPPAPVLNFAEPVTNEVSDDIAGQEENTAAEQTSSVTIEDILAAVEKENLDSGNSETTSESREFGFDSEMIFDTSKSEDWDSIIIPPMEDAAEDAENQSDTSDTALNHLLEACFNDEAIAAADDENDIFALSDDGNIAAEVLSELNSDINQNEYSAEEMFDITEDLSDITAEAFGEDDNDTEQTAEAAFDISEDNSSESVSEDSEVISVESDEDGEQAEIDETEAAVNAKLQKLVEAAELAELVRVENEEAEIVTGGSDRTERSGYDLISASENSSANGSDSTGAAEANEEVKEYTPKAKTAESEEVFESVLIVDDGVGEDDSEDESLAEEQDSTLFLRSKAEDECPTAVFKLPEEPILPTDIDDGDFQEQWLDDEEDSDEMASRSKRARRRISAFIGAVTILFVLVGAIWILKTAVMGLNSIGSTGEKKAEYTQFISPVVLTDPNPFESVEGANNQMLLESAIWSVLDSKDESSGYNYEYDDTGKIVLPAGEVEEAAKKLFGDNIKMNMDVLSETDGNVLYYYDSIEDKFHITTGGIIGPSAGITKIAQKSDYVSLIVGYYSQADMNSASSDEVEAYKYMEYILSFDEKGEYHIESIRDYVE